MVASLHRGPLLLPPLGVCDVSRCQGFAVEGAPAVLTCACGLRRATAVLACEVAAHEFVGEKDSAEWMLRVQHNSRPQDVQSGSNCSAHKTVPGWRRVFVDEGSFLASH